jgi:hypothetical protein
MQGVHLIAIGLGIPAAFSAGLLVGDGTAAGAAGAVAGFGVAAIVMAIDGWLRN